MRAHEQTIYGNTQHTTHWKTITGAHVANYCNYELNRDVEKHPGSSIYVDPNETTVAPYSQGK